MAELTDTALESVAEDDDGENQWLKTFFYLNNRIDYFSERHNSNHCEDFGIDQPPGFFLHELELNGQNLVLSDQQQHVIVPRGDTPKDAIDLTEVQFMLTRLCIAN